MRFNAPPGWPQPPDGWTPPAGWQPDPSWPAAPAGWTFWVAEHPSRGRRPVPAASPRPARVAPALLAGRGAVVAVAALAVSLMGALLQPTGSAAGRSVAGGPGEAA